MKRIMLVVVVTSALVSGAAVTRTALPAVDTDKRAVTSFGPIESHNGWLRGEVVEHSPLGSGGAARWLVRLETATNHQRIANAQVLVTAFMPEDSTVASRPAVARNMGDGRYEITRLQLNRAGWWNIGLVVRYGERTDSLAFNLLTK